MSRWDPPPAPAPVDVDALVAKSRDLLEQAKTVVDDDGARFTLSL